MTKVEAAAAAAAVGAVGALALGLPAIEKMHEADPSDDFARLMARRGLILLGTGAVLVGVLHGMASGSAWPLVVALGVAGAVAVHYELARATVPPGDEE